MSNPLENLGDYNRVRIDLQAKDGNLEALYEDVGNTAVAKATPGLMLQGGIIGAAITVLLYEGFRFMKERKEKLKKESVLKKKFIESISEASNVDIEESTDSNT